jgi:cytochrome P450
LRQKRRGERALARSVQQLIAQREALDEEDSPHDLLSTLLYARDPETGERMSRQQLQDELITLYIAGHDTTAILLSWVWVLLAQHPDVLASLSTELDGVLAGRLPTATDLPRLPTVQAIVKEALRLYPPAWYLFRQAAGPLTLGDAEISDGSILFLMPYTTQRDARWFSEPELFRPQRWLDGLEKSLPRGAYFPFGMGPRTCIGSGFAMMEAQLLLATIAQQFCLELLDEAVMGHTATLGFARPVRMRLHRRPS